MTARLLDRALAVATAPLWVPVGLANEVARYLLRDTWEDFLGSLNDELPAREAAPAA